jgi:hypothetical protein
MPVYFIDAEEEECKEAILAYYFLLNSTYSMSRRELDRSIESWFAEKWNCTIDFEIDDALDKLLNLGLVTVENDQRLSAIDLEDAQKALMVHWQNAGM